MRKKRRTKKKKRRKLFEFKKRRTPKGFYSRLIIGRFKLGFNSHEFKKIKKVKHVHFGEKVKVVLHPPKLIDIWIKKGRKYERFSKIAWEKIKGIGRRKRRRNKSQP